MFCNYTATRDCREDKTSGCVWGAGGLGWFKTPLPSLRLWDDRENKFTCFILVHHYSQYLQKVHAVLLINSAKLDTSRLFLSLLNDTFEDFLEGKIFKLSQFVSRFVAERTVRFSTVTSFPSIPCFYREFMVFDHLFSSEPRIWSTLPSPPPKKAPSL